MSAVPAWPAASILAAFAILPGADVAAGNADSPGALPSGASARLSIGTAPLHAAYLAASIGDPPDSDDSDETDEFGEATKAAATSAFGAADTLRVNLLGGVVSNLSNSTGGTVRAEFEYFMADWISIVPLAEVGWLGRPDADDAVLAGGAVLLRWHLLHEREWTVYADAGVGLVYLSEAVPSETNRIKFSPQVGVGFTLALEEDPAAARLMGGVRWYHLSNARTASSNDGFDGVMAYLGVSLPF